MIKSFYTLITIFSMSCLSGFDFFCNDHLIGMSRWESHGWTSSKRW